MFTVFKDESRGKKVAQSFPSTAKIVTKYCSERFFFLFVVRKYRLKPNIMGRNNVIYIEAWYARDIPLGFACTRYGFDSSISLANQV